MKNLILITALIFISSKSWSGDKPCICALQNKSQKEKIGKKTKYKNPLKLNDEEAALAGQKKRKRYS